MHDFKFTASFNLNFTIYVRWYPIILKLEIWRKILTLTMLIRKKDLRIYGNVLLDF